MTWENEDLVLSDNKEDQDVSEILDLVTKTYWAGGRTKEQMEKVVTNSLCFSLRQGDELVGFVRVISDYTKMSWVSDMVVAEKCRGKGLGYWMMKMVMSHPELRGTQFALQTKDAQTFYSKLGFSERPSLMSTSVTYL